MVELNYKKSPNYWSIRRNFFVFHKSQRKTAYWSECFVFITFISKYKRCCIWTLRFSFFGSQLKDSCKPLLLGIFQIAKNLKCKHAYRESVICHYTSSHRDSRIKYLFNFQLYFYLLFSIILIFCMQVD